MRRPKRTTRTPRLRWMASASSSDPSPMERLMSWLERHGEEYRTSKRKIDMLEQLGEEMATSGIYGLTVSSIRSQLLRLKNGVQMKAEGGKCTMTDVNRYYDRLLALLFDDEERAQMRERAAAARADEETASPRMSRRTRTRSQPIVPRGVVNTVPEGTVEGAIEARGTILQPIGPDTTEIHRRFELLSARQKLQQQGVDPDTIDSLLPLPL
ncbi:hypothetical protein PHYPSEUDO_014993 [Phytophthora pseudosyringae]|uniref:Uncharacterized protein n=1 Tax=Phytophthora pseudosyringae TaxID=221518 RepID=A0A8T1WH98_9STRA|nr:hypothetical protein PHYPSEUDO_014993 [Phytophthora pseudosyringae]